MAINTSIPVHLNLRDISKLNEGDVMKPKYYKSIQDMTRGKDKKKSLRELICGTLTGCAAGYGLIRVGKIAAFGLGARSSLSVASLTSAPEPVERPPPDTTPSKPEPFKTPDEPNPNLFFDKGFLPQKPKPHSPKISPSSIPNPNPSVSMTKQVESGYPNYGGYLYSIPGYSAFQPISYPGVLQPNQAPVQPTETPMDFAFNTLVKETTIAEDKTPDPKPVISQPEAKQTDFEEQFTPEVIPAVSIPETSKAESKMSITSLAQGSGATVTIPSQAAIETKKKSLEKFSLKTSIPISKIDMKCVNTQHEAIVQNPAPSIKAPVPFNPAFYPQKIEPVKLEIQSNVIIRNAPKEIENKIESKCTQNNSINTLLNAADVISKSEAQFRKPEPKQDVINEIKDPPPPNFTPPKPSPVRPIFNPINIDTNKVNFPNKQPESLNNDPKNQILFIQNKTNQTNPKMLVTIQQQNPQVLLQRTNFDPKNLQAPSRLSSQSKKCKEDAVENGLPSNVVALKRLHQENCDENDFENLITENQIYGNKIVVKEKSQGTQQEQDLKNKIDKNLQNDTKNVVLQPNFLYLSNVQFPGNLMMIKNNNKVNQTDKVTKLIPNENKTTSEVSTMTNGNDIKPNASSNKIQNTSSAKEIHVLKTNCSVTNNKNTKTDLVFQTQHPKVIMNPQIVYQVPMLVDADNKLNQPFNNREYPKFVTPNKKEFPKQFDPPKSSDKLFIACPYQMDSKLQPKIVITNIRPKIAKVDEVSSLDLYEKRRRLRRLKYLSNREGKDNPKTDTRKPQDSRIDAYRNIITPDKMKAEIYKEFTKTRVTIDEGSSDSDTDYGEDDLVEYNAIIKEHSVKHENMFEKTEFLANFRLGSHQAFKEKQLDRQERTLRRDSVASAYIAAGRIDKLTREDDTAVNLQDSQWSSPLRSKCEVDNEDGIATQKQQNFLSQLSLFAVSPQFKEGYEKSWQEIIKERKRRNDSEQSYYQPSKHPKGTDCDNLDLDTNGQLQILTEIKKSVTDNNNLIKKRLDSNEEGMSEGDTIRTLAEKNFSELNRLSKMADRSVKIITGQDNGKRDLNPGFDSENIQKHIKIQPHQNYPSINIPNISKIISLKTEEMTTSVMTSSQATSMDEPQNSAAGLEMMEKNPKIDFACQVDDTFTWPGLEALVKKYKEYDIARKKEIADLHRRNTALRVSGAQVTRGAGHSAERARALLAERQHLARDEHRLRASLARLLRVADDIRGVSVPIEKLIGVKP